jgi:hypothetical protein
VSMGTTWKCLPLPPNSHSMAFEPITPYIVSSKLVVICE